MPNSEPQNGPILRLFQVQTKPGCAGQLVEKFATTSADVVVGEPGNKGYFFGRGVEHDQDYVVFASVWQSMDAVKSRFGEDWNISYLPPGYETMIESCSVHHIDMNNGWHVELSE